MRKKNESAFFKILHSIYLNPKAVGSFGGKERLYQAAKLKNKLITRSVVDKFLRETDVYWLFRPVRHRFPRVKTYAPRSGIFFQTDLADLSRFKVENDGVAYILVVIDSFTRRLYARPLKSKADTTNAFAQILDDIEKYVGSVPHLIVSDRGSEFTNHRFQRLLKHAT
jgi:transposase InsO family protein